MPLTIFDTDPDAKPAPRVSYSDDTVGRFHSGRAVVNSKGKKIPEALDQWRVSTADRAVADAIAQLFGGEPIEDEHSEAENFIDVFTNADSVPVILAGVKAIQTDMKQWNNGKLVHHCDGSHFLSHPSRDEMIGQPCGCPELFAERKQAAYDGIGPSPSITVTFRLADDPDLGEFKFQTSSWSFASVVHEYEDDLASVGGEAVAELAIELVEYVAKKGKRKGQTISYNKPVLSRIRSYNSAVAE